MRFQGLDLNLLVVLDSLLELQNLTRTAERLNTTQPAMSAALRRLREYFDDDLLVANRKRMVPTAYAERLRQPIKALLSDTKALLSTQARFDPATTERTFRIMASDFVISTVLSEIMPFLAQHAPGIAFNISPPGDEAVPLLENCDLDLLFSPRQFLSSEHPCALLFSDRHVIAGWSENPMIAAPISADAMRQCKFVSPEIGRQRRSFAIEELAEKGVHLQIAVGAAYFSMVTELIEGTTLLAVIPEMLARKAARTRPIRWQPLPVKITPLREYLQFHRTRSEDPGLQWLMGLLESWSQHQRQGRPASGQASVTMDARERNFRPPFSAVVL